jgi:hypothetical protein
VSGLSKTDMNDRDSITLSQTLIAHHAGICLSCAAKKTSLTAEEIASEIEYFRTVAPVMDYYQKCPVCAESKHLYSIHYPVP